MEPQIYIALISVVFFPLANTYKNDIYECSKKAGYIAEPHTIVTEDGYILTIMRIKVPTDGEAELSKKEPILLQHGLSGSSEHFTIAENESLAFFLLKEGYDVWAGNFRGTFHSRRHKTLDPDRDYEFWRFSLDQHAKYDVRAMIDHILKVTGKKSMAQAGHSLGSSALLALLASYPEYNEKINVHIALAPAVYESHLNILFKKLVYKHYKFLINLANFIGLYEIPSPCISPPVAFLMRLFCGWNTPNREKLCQEYLRLFEPSDQSLLHKDYMSLYADTQPGGVGIYQMFHFLQFTRTGKFGRYDWGPDLNLKIHNSSIAEPYNLKLITAPVAILYGKSDSLANPKDVAQLAKELPNLVAHEPIEHKLFNHISFLMARNLTMLMNKPILKILKKIHNK